MTIEDFKKSPFEVEMIQKNVITYQNAIRYADYLIYHSDVVYRKDQTFSFHRDGYEPGDKEWGQGETIEDCIDQINEQLLEQL